MIVLRNVRHLTWIECAFEFPVLRRIRSCLVFIWGKSATAAMRAGHRGLATLYSKMTSTVEGNLWMATYAR